MQIVHQQLIKQAVGGLIDEEYSLNDNNRQLCILILNE